MKRHWYYCRDKRGSSRRARMRSCEACIKAKTRCNNAQPSCARCTTRHHPCAYTKQSYTGRPKACDDTSLHQTYYQGDVETAGVPDALPPARPPNGNTDSIEAATDLSESIAADSGLALPNWGASRRDVSSIDKWGPFVPMLPQLQHQEGRIDTIPRMPTFHLRSFAQSKSMIGRTSPSARLMSHMLTSLPKTMYSAGSLPPFIHPYSLGSNPHKPVDGFESLTTCVMLMQMISSGTTGSRKLFWKIVRVECERLQVEVPFPSYGTGYCAPLTDYQIPTFDKWNLLSSMQALTVYILVRLQEGETVDNNHDVLLLSTFKVRLTTTTLRNSNSLVADYSLRSERTR